MSFPDNVAIDALASCGRCCCICHKFCGTKIELHHIAQKAYGGDDSFENCIPLFSTAIPIWERVIQSIRKGKDILSRN